MLEIERKRLLAELRVIDNLERDLGNGQLPDGLARRLPEVLRDLERNDGQRIGAYRLLRAELEANGKGEPMYKKDVTTNEEAKAAGWEIIFGPAAESNTDGWVLVQKAVYSGKQDTIMKSTKRLAVPGGFLYQTETVIEWPAPGIGTLARVHSQALAFVPEPIVAGEGQFGTTRPGGKL